MNEHGKVLLIHFWEVLKDTGVRAPELDGPPMPEAGLVIMEWFKDMSDRRQSFPGYSAMVKQPLTSTEMRHYFALWRIRPTPWQLRILYRLDALYLANAGLPDVPVESMASGDDQG